VAAGYSLLVFSNKADAGLIVVIDIIEASEVGIAHNRLELCKLAKLLQSF
jgi:hypothetical protein